jgi:dynamin 1-like protein
VYILLICAYLLRKYRFLLQRDEKNDHVRGGARIRHVFLNVFNPALDDLDPASELTDDEIRTSIKNAGGITGSLLIPEAPFELLVSRAIERLLRPALQCREFVHQELVHIASQAVPSEVARFPRLRSRMMDAVEEFILQGAAPAEVRCVLISIQKDGSLNLTRNIPPIIPSTPDRQ